MTNQVGASASSSSRLAKFFVCMMAVLVAIPGAALLAAPKDAGQQRNPESLVLGDHGMEAASLFVPSPPKDGETSNSTFAGACPITVVTNDGSTSGNERCPNGNFAGGRAHYIVTASEMAAAGITGTVTFNAIGFHYVTAPAIAASAPLKIYLQNTAATTDTLSATWATAISTMTLVANATTTLPASTTPFDIPFGTGGAAATFTYTGGGLFVGFDWGPYAGTLTSAICAANTTTGAATSTAAQRQTNSQGTTLGALSAFHPETRLTPTTATVNNDAGVNTVVTYGSVPVGAVGPQAVKAVITNNGFNTLTNQQVSLNVAGVDTFSNTQTIASLASCGGQAVVTFASFTPSAIGSDTVTVSVPADDVATNNTKAVPMNGTGSQYDYKLPGSTLSGGVGLTGASGAFVGKFTTTVQTQVVSVNLEFAASSATTYKIAIYGDNGGTPSTSSILYQDAANRTVSVAGPTTITLPSPVTVGPGNFYVGLQQTNTTNASLSFDTEAPIRTGSFFLATALPVATWIDFAPGNNFKLNIGVNINRCFNVTCSASDACHTPGTCNTNTGVCGAQGNAGAGTACGSAASSQCDDPDTCDGAGNCQSNFKSAATPCVGVSQGGDCDDADHCSGNSAACVDGYFSSSTVCRGSAGQCDVAENCTGSSGACPADVFASSSTPCLGASQGGTCDDDAADRCSGTSNSCNDAFKSGSTTCRPSVGQCDVAESCTGTSGACPADGFASSSTPCLGASQGDTCDDDAADRCSGTSNSCNDAFKSSSFECRASAGQCDVAENCSGFSGACPPDGYAASGTGCNDGFGCTLNDACNGSGSCLGTQKDCSDNTVCTSDNCVEPSGTCDNTQPSGACDIVGLIRYYSNNNPVPNEFVERTSNLEATAQHATDAGGQYTFADDAGNVTLTPQDRVLADETECYSATTATDATQIAKASILLVTLTPNQTIAADVSGFNGVTGFDAALVSQRAVAASCVNYHYPIRNATGSDWAWVPASKNYSPLQGGENYDFTGILYGDVTGNWVAPVLLTSANTLDPEAGTALNGATVVGAGNVDPLTPVSSGAVMYLAGEPHHNTDGTWEVVLGLQNADGILALDMNLRYNPAAIHILGVTTTGIGSGLNIQTNDQNGRDLLVLFGNSAMQGSGAFLKVTYSMTTQVDGVPFSVNGKANEGMIPILRSPALTGGGGRLHQAGVVQE